jgi:Protein of unknown function (DUF2510)
MSSTTSSSAGWYADPYGAPLWRWFDGESWTAQTAPIELGADAEARLGPLPPGPSLVETAGRTLWFYAAQGDPKEWELMLDDVPVARLSHAGAPIAIGPVAARCEEGAWTFQRRGLLAAAFSAILAGPETVVAEYRTQARAVTLPSGATRTWTGENGRAKARLRQTPMPGRLSYGWGDRAFLDSAGTVLVEGGFSVIDQGDWKWQSGGGLPSPTMITLSITTAGREAPDAALLTLLMAYLLVLDTGTRTYVRGGIELTRPGTEGFPTI